MPVTQITVQPEIGHLQADNTSKAAAPGFAEQLEKLVSEVNSEMKSSEIASEAFAEGKTNNIHEVMLAAERATVAFRLVGSIRNHILGAYNEVMRMGM